MPQTQPSRSTRLTPSSFAKPLSLSLSQFSALVSLCLSVWIIYYIYQGLGFALNKFVFAKMCKNLWLFSTSKSLSVLLLSGKSLKLFRLFKLVENSWRLLHFWRQLLQLQQKIQQHLTIRIKHSINSSAWNLWKNTKEFLGISFQFLSKFLHISSFSHRPNCRKCVLFVALDASTRSFPVLWIAHAGLFTPQREKDNPKTLLQESAKYKDKK